MEKLYYLDSHTRRFTATVLECRAAGKEWEVALDRTAFFPEGGGQKSDAGVLGGVRVLETREREGVVWHRCAAPLGVGETVEGEIDWETRFSRMQLHSGEHIVSGIAYSLWGCENVGFHMSEDSATLDFDKELSMEQVAELERRANEAVWADLPYRAWFPSPEELAAMEYRSKKELKGEVRIVEVEGVDRCACCAPHMYRTGEVGMIRIADAARHRGGMRLIMRAGRCALEEAIRQGKDMSALSALFSVPVPQVCGAAEKLKAELENTRALLNRSEKLRMEQQAAALAPTEGNLWLFEETAGRDAMREWCNAAVKKCRLCAAFSGRDGEWQYVMASGSMELKKMANTINAAIHGHGGGKDMIQGSCTATRAEIEKFLEEFHG